jgi:hypothetical protein
MNAAKLSWTCGDGAMADLKGYIGCQSAPAQKAENLHPVAQKAAGRPDGLDDGSHLDFGDRQDA